MRLLATTSARILIGAILPWRAQRGRRPQRAGNRRRRPSGAMTIGTSCEGATLYRPDSSFASASTTSMPNRSTRTSSAAASVKRPHMPLVYSSALYWCSSARLSASAPLFALWPGYARSRKGGVHSWCRFQTTLRCGTSSLLTRYLDGRNDNGARVPEMSEQGDRPCPVRGCPTASRFDVSPQTNLSVPRVRPSLLRSSGVETIVATTGVSHLTCRCKTVEGSLIRHLRARVLTHAAGLGHVGRNTKARPAPRSVSTCWNWRARRELNPRPLD